MLHGVHRKITNHNRGSRMKNFNIMSTIACTMMTMSLGAMIPNDLEQYRQCKEYQEVLTQLKQTTENENQLEMDFIFTLENLAHAVPHDTAVLLLKEALQQTDLMFDTVI